MERREFISSAAAAAAVLALPGCERDENGRFRRRRRRATGEWAEVQRLFTLDPDHVHMAGMLVTSHPAPVLEAIEQYRAELDANPGQYLEDRNQELQRSARQAAAAYMGVNTSDVALTESTTMGIAFVYNGVGIRPDQEFLTTSHDYYSTHESLRFRAQRTGCGVRVIEPFADAASASADEVVDRIVGAVQPNTRMLALTWVHSWSGIRIPVRQIADRVAEVNAGRGPEDRVLIGLDGVHGLGAVDESVADLGCDFFMAGTHKWMFAPRGTGVLWGRPETQAAVTPTIPTFSNDTAWGGVMTRGGFTAFEHQWSMRHAFELHDELGRSAVAERITELATMCKEGLAAISGVRVRTPRDPALSAGIISFDVDGMSAQAVVSRLDDRNIIASVTPYDPPHARLSPGIFNDESDVEATLEAVREIA